MPGLRKDKEMSIKWFVNLFKQGHEAAEAPSPQPQPPTTIGAGIPTGAATPLDQARARIEFDLYAEQAKVTPRPEPSNPGSPADVVIQGERKIADVSRVADTIMAGATKPSHPYGK
jgi:hypothetical protein